MPALFVRHCAAVFAGLWATAALAQPVPCLVLGDAALPLATAAGPRAPVFLASDCAALRAPAGVAATALRVGWVGADGRPVLAALTPQGPAALPADAAAWRGVRALGPALATAAEPAAPAEVAGFGADRPLRLFIPAAGLELVARWPWAARASLLGPEGQLLREWAQPAGGPLRLLGADAKSEGLLTLRLQDTEGQAVVYRWRNLTPELQALLQTREAELASALPDAQQRRWMQALLFDAMRLPANRALVLGQRPD